MKTYQNYNQALKNCNGYEDQELVSIISQKTHKFVEELSNNQNLLDQSFKNLAIILKVITDLDKKEINVIDFGGQLGATFFEIRKLISENIKLNWNVIETEKMTQIGKKYHQNQDLNFSNNLDDFKKTDIDIIIASGSIQYTPNPIKFINKIIDIQPHYIYFCRLPLNCISDENIITTQSSNLQDNGPTILDNIKDKKITYPITIITKSNFETAVLSSNKYTQVLKNVNTSNMYKLIKDYKTPEFLYLFKKNK